MPGTRCTDADADAAAVPPPPRAAAPEPLRTRHAVAHRDDVCRFIVEDTGIGIAAADLERIFVPFERVAEGAAAEIAGTGLGLTITKLLTGVLGGELSVESEFGKGSRFTARLYIPAVREAAATTTKREDYSRLTAAGLVVLVADDDVNQRNLVRDLLGPLGVTVAEAANV